MKSTFAFILSIIILLILTACGKTVDDSVLPNEPSVSFDSPELEMIPDLESTPENNFLNGTEQNENDEYITTSPTTPVPETVPPPTSALETMPTAAPPPAQTPVETTPTPTSAPTPQPILTPTPQPTDIPTSEFSPSPEPESEPSNISVTVGGSVFSVKLYNNDTARAFVALLPMTLNMSELNGNEKYYYLPDKLPSASGQVKSINTGDLMLYGTDCLVLFYESFSTSYSYTRIGCIEDVSGLADALGSGSVEIVLSK